MSMQADELRSKAKLLRSHADGLAAPLVIPSTKELMALTMLDSASRMEQAADTIEKLGTHSNQLEPSRYFELFGTPERAARTLADNCEYLDYCGQCWVRAANCDGKYSTVLEWLRGDAE